MSDGSVLLTGIMHDVTDIAVANRELGARQLAPGGTRGRSLQHLAETDALTGCLNRRALFERAVREGSGREIGIILMDLDHFKSVNDTYGHEGGDQALQAFVACARQQLRGADLFARLGGEEFVVALPEMAAPELLRNRRPHPHGLGRHAAGPCGQACEADGVDWRDGLAGAGGA